MRSTHLFALALGAAFCAPSIAADLAAPGMGMTQWQWSCLSDLAAAKAARPAPLNLSALIPPAAGLGSQGPALAPPPAPTGPGPLEPSVIAKSLPSGPQENRWALKEGSSWRGVPVSAYVERFGPYGLESYFIAPLSAQELSERLAAGSPFSSGQAQMATPPRKALTQAQTRRLLAPIDPPPNPSASASHVGCFGLRLPGDHPALRVRAASR